MPCSCRVCFHTLIERIAAQQVYIVLIRVAYNETLFAQGIVRLHTLSVFSLSYCTWEIERYDSKVPQHEMNKLQRASKGSTSKIVLLAGHCQRKERWYCYFVPQSIPEKLNLRNPLCSLKVILG